MTRSAERYQLIRVAGIGYQVVVGGYYLVNIDQICGVGHLASAWMSHVSILPCELELRGGTAKTMEQ